MKILIIDDTKSIHTFVKFMFSKARGIETTSVYNGAEAIELLKSGIYFDLILLDWEMPVMTGPETLESLKNNNINVPVIMMTTKNSTDDMIRVLQLGAREYIMKPFTDDILFEKIQMVTGKELKRAG